MYTTATGTLLSVLLLQGCCQHFPGGPLIKRRKWKSLSHVQLCDPMDCGPPVSSVHGILQAKILEWIAIPFSRGSFNPGMEPRSPPLQADSYRLSYREEDPLGFPLKKWSEVTQSCLTLCDTMNYSLPGFSVHGIFQSRVLEWIAGLSYCILPFTWFLQMSFTNLLCNSGRSHHLIVCTFLNL